MGITDLRFVVNDFQNEPEFVLSTTHSSPFNLTRLIWLVVIFNYNHRMVIC